MWQISPELIGKNRAPSKNQNDPKLKTPNNQWEKWTRSYFCQISKFAFIYLRSRNMNFELSDKKDVSLIIFFEIFFNVLGHQHTYQGHLNSI